MIKTKRMVVLDKAVKRVPAITNIDPANNTIVTDINKIITITFNENIQPGPNYNNIKLWSSYQGGTIKPSTITINNNILTLTATTPLNDYNLLTPNQQTGTDTLGDTTGFSGNATLTSSTEQAHTGTRSLKAVTPNESIYEGIFINTIGALSTTYVIGFWVYCPVTSADAMELTILNTDMVTVRQTFTGTGNWQYVEQGFTTAGTTTAISILIRTKIKQAITFYVDDLTLTENDYTYTIIIPINSITDLAGNPLQNPFTSTFTVETTPE